MSAVVRTKSISADEARHLRKDQVRVDASGREVMLKAAAAPSSWDAAARSARFVMSTQGLDRYGDVVVTDGLDLAQFEKNPVALLSHRSDSWPIGDWKNVEKVLRGRPPRLEGDLVFHKAGGPIPEIDQCAWMCENGYMRGASIGFIPDFKAVDMLMADDGSWTGGLQFNEAEIVEASLCALPANADSLAKMCGGNLRLAKESIEDVLDNWARSPEGVLVPRAEFEKLYFVVKANGEKRVGQPLKFLPELSKTGPNWKCGASRDLPISDSDAWDGGAAAERLLDAANIKGDPDGPDSGSPDYAMAAKGFLAHDAQSPDLRGSYKLPFADIVGGKMTAMPGGLRAAASRLPQTDIPENCMTEARGVIDAYMEKMSNKVLLDFAEKEYAKMGKVVADKSRVAKDGEMITDRGRIEAIERAAKQKRLEDKRKRDKAVRESKINALKQI